MWPVAGLLICEVIEMTVDDLEVGISESIERPVAYTLLPIRITALIFSEDRRCDYNWRGVVNDQNTGVCKGIP